MGPSPHLWFFGFKTTTFGSELHVSMGPRPHLMVLWMQNRRRLTLRGTSLCMGPRPSSPLFACKTATFGPELQVSMCTRPHLSFCACDNSVISTRNTCLYGFQPSSVVLSIQNCDFRTKIAYSLLGAWPSSSDFVHEKQSALASEILVSMCPSPHLVVLCIQNSVISTRITTFYGFQPSSVVLCIQNSALRTKIA